MNKNQFPSDVDPHSRSRLPLPKREELNEAGQQAFDRANRPGTIAGLQGPAGIQLHCPEIAPHLSALNTYFRVNAGFTPQTREIAILATAREMDSQFEWVAHEPEALKEGVAQHVIDVIKFRRCSEGLAEQDALVIELARQLWRDHKVAPETFAKLNAGYGPRMLINLVVLMGTYANTAAMLAVVDMQIPEGKEPLLPIP
jgi:4-carboxymuconolactone decarboxylase